MNPPKRPQPAGLDKPHPAPKPMAPANHGRSGQGADSALEHLQRDRKAKAAAEGRRKHDTR